MDILDKWAVTMATGGRPVVSGLVFPAVASTDGKYAIVVLEHQLRVYFLSTRQCIRTVDVDVADTVAVMLDPGNGSQLVFFAPNGVRYVNWKEKLSQPVVASQTLTWGENSARELADVFAALENAYFGVCRTAASLLLVQIDRESAECSVLFECPQTGLYAVSRDSTKLAVVFDAHSVSLYDISCLSAGDAAVQATKETFACARPSALAVSNDGIIAAGNSNGAIDVMYGGVSGGHPARTFRWHMDPVRSLTFSHDNTYLVSGGNEQVLVFWHVALERTQFLPRLAGPIDRVFVDPNRPDHYGVALRVEDSHEIVVLLAADLVSRLAVAPVRLGASVRHAEAKARRHFLKGHLAMRHNVSVPVAVHPTLRHVYCMSGASVQAYDVVRGEQAFVQHAAPQLSTGRVRSEHILADPAVTHVSFSADGSWMATVDAAPLLGDNLMLKNDVTYALKFWKHTDESEADGVGSWALVLKVVDPHGPGSEVGAVFLLHAGFTSIDVFGGVRVWKNATGAWTLLRVSAAIAKKSAVAGCYSPDGSLLVVAHGCNVSALDPVLLSVLHQLPSLDLPVEKVAFAGEWLVLASSTRLETYDLVRGVFGLSLRIGPGAGNLVAVDSARKLILVAANHFEQDPLLRLAGKLVVLAPDSLEPVFSSDHHAGVVSVAATASGFVFLDSDCRLGLLAPQAKRNLGDDADLVLQMDRMLLAAQAAASVMNGDRKEPQVLEKWTAHKSVDTAVLQPIFANVDGVGVDTLFERIVRAVR